MPRVSLGRRLLLAVALGASFCSAASASEFSKTQFMRGLDLGSPVMFQEPVRSAAQAQEGPNRGETRDAYGRRVQRAGEPLG